MLVSGGVVYFMLKSVVLSLFLAGHDAESALAEGEQLVLTGVGGDGSDPAEVVGQGLGRERVVGNAAGQNDLIDLAVQHGSHSAGVLGDLVEEGIPHLLGQCIAGLGHLADLTGIVGVQVAVKAAVAADLLVDLLLGVLTAEAHLDQITDRHGAAALGAEAALAIENVVHIHDLAVVMGADRDTAAHVDDDEVQLVVALAVLLGKAAGNGLLVQRMENRAAGQLRHTGNARLIGQFIDNHRVHDVAGHAQRITDLAGKDAAQIGGMLPLNTGLQVSEQRIADGIGAARNGLEQAAAADNDIQRLGVAVLLLQEVENDLLAEIFLINDAGILGDLLGGVAQRFFKQQQEYVGHINGQVEEVYGGHTVIKAFNKEETTLKEFRETNEVLYKSAWKAQFFSGLMQPVMMFVGNLGYVGVAISGAALAIRGTITIGDIQAFIQYVKNFTQPIQQVAQVTNMMQQMAAAAERVFELLEEEEEVQVVEHPASVENIKGEVDFRHVKFGYDPEKIIIHDFSVHVDPGKQVAIVGPTGAGKTTMVKLLMRFYDVNEGAILLDGHNVKEYNRRELRDALGMVLQETWLFKGTIMENIRYGRLDATDEEVIAAAKAAHAHRFISALPGGYQMELNEEVTNISQGQKQLLTIARAILANNPVLILDEATSSVDTRTEHSIQRAMDNLMKGRTSFVIAHRLSTIKNADIILVMKDGDIIEQGNHEELMAQNGFYAELYNSQFEQVS